MEWWHRDLNPDLQITNLTLFILGLVFLCICNLATEKEILPCLGPKPLPL